MQDRQPERRRARLPRRAVDAGIRTSPRTAAGSRSPRGQPPRAPPRTSRGRHRGPGNPGRGAGSETTRCAGRYCRRCRPPVRRLRCRAPPWSGWRRETMVQARPAAPLRDPAPVPPSMRGPAPPVRHRAQSTRTCPACRSPSRRSDAGRRRPAATRARPSSEGAHRQRTSAPPARPSSPKRACARIVAASSARSYSAISSIAPNQPRY